MTLNPKSDERRTPREIFDPLHRIFDFNLDAAASDKNHLVKRYFTIEQSALSRPWGNGVRAWLNPPYSRYPGVLASIEKVILEVKAGRVETALVLTQSDTSTEWYRRLFNTADAIFFTRRLKFDTDDRVESDGAKFGSTIAVFGLITDTQWARMRSSIQPNCGHRFPLEEKADRDKAVYEPEESVSLR